MLKYYTRDRHGNRNGCLITFKENNKVAIGFSKCCKRDKFCKDLATEIAESRAIKMVRGEHEYSIPFSMEEEYSKMKDRAMAFYKGCEIL